MELTKSRGQSGPRLTVAEKLVLICLVLLAYWSIPALIGLGLFLIWSLWQRGTDIWRDLYRAGWVWLGLLMIASVAVSFFPGESALQLFNFVPFFLFLGAIAAAVRQSAQTWFLLEQWALWPLMATIPINLRAILEYYFKAPGQVERWHDASWLQWLYSQPDYGHRADSVFSHPNFLASYLIIIFGLGLGLGICSLTQQWSAQKAGWILSTNLLTLIGIFCSGSRNGLLVAGVQFLLFFWLMRRYRAVVLVGVAAFVAVGIGVFTIGIGGRTITQAIETTTLRLDVWVLAISMIQEHPWLGTGLGSFKRLYEPYTIPLYESLQHAHNLPLMLWAELGLPIMLLFNGVVGATIYRALRAVTTPKNLIYSPSAVLIGYLLGFGGCVLASMFDLSLYDSRVNVLGWLTLAVIHAAPQVCSPAISTAANETKSA